ncbi:MAG: nuclear transport factor 2 family protein [Deltaproteobacteria bacterium]|nr:nuclear transport factor 2 family protein [Deltaproteobacteria bacterium]
MTQRIGSSQGHRSATVALVAFAALGLMFGLAPRAEADVAGNKTERANVKVVDDFIAAWSDPDKAATFLAPEASVRMEEDKPAIVGQKAVADAFKGFMKPGVTLHVKTLRTTVHGPVVLNKRVDTLKTKDQPDQVFPVVGVFVVKNGKIVEWTDYLDK